MGKSKPNVSRIENPTSNPTLSNLRRYLAAIGSTLTDFDQETRGFPPGRQADVDFADPAREFVRETEARLAGDPEFRAKAEAMAAEVSLHAGEKAAEPLLQLIRDQGKRIKALEDRLATEDLANRG